MKTLIFFALLLIAPFQQSFAGEPELFESFLISPHTQVNLYKENSKWIADGVQTKPHQLPRLKSRKTFSSRDEALLFLNLSESIISQKQNAIDWDLQNFEFRTETSLDEVLWKSEHSWDWSWELKYAEWLKTVGTADYLKDHNVATDCADVAYAYRWIFARIHKLEMASRLPGSNIIFSNESMQRSWRNLPTHEEWHKDRRFMAGLNYLLNMTYTHSLMADSYPIAINQEAFLAGTHFLNLGTQSGHTQLMVEVVTSGNQLPVYLVQSTVPRELRTLDRSPLAWIFQPNSPKTMGFLKIRWPKKQNQSWSFVASAQMPHYSVEQYDENFSGKEGHYGLAFLKRLNPEFSVFTQLQEALSNLKNLFLSRQEVVQKGYEFCQKTDCSPGSVAYDNWSTPSRDLRILENLTSIQNFVNTFSEIDPRLIELWKQSLAEDYLTEDGQSYSLNALKYTWDNQLYNSDPRLAPEVRWALKPSVIVNKLTQDLNSAIDSRRAKIENNPCENQPQVCPRESGLFKQWASFKEDAILATAPQILTHYCNYHQVRDCEELHRLAESTLINWDQADRKILLKEFLDLQLWINSDPLSSKPQRWGSMNHQLRHFILPPPEQVVEINKDLSLWLTPYAEGSKAYLLNKSEFTSRAVPLGLEGFKVHAQSGRLLYLNTKTQTLEVNSIERVLASQPGIPIPKGFSYFWLNKNHVAVANTEELYQIYRIDEDLQSATVFGTRFPSLMPSQSSSDYVMKLSGPGRVAWASLKDEPLYFKEIFHPSLGYIYGNGFVEEIAGRLMLRAVRDLENSLSCFFVFDPVREELTPLSQICGHSLDFDPFYKFAVIQGPDAVWFQKFDSDLRPNGATLRMGQHCWPCSFKASEYILTHDEDGKNKIWTQDPIDGLKEIILPTEATPIWVHRGLAMTQHKGPPGGREVWNLRSLQKMANSTSPNFYPRDMDSENYFYLADEVEGHTLGSVLSLEDPNQPAILTISRPPNEYHDSGTNTSIRHPGINAISVGGGRVMVFKTPSKQ